jgi:hypothetical protein
MRMKFATIQECRELVKACEAMLALTKVCTVHYRSNDERKAIQQAKAALAAIQDTNLTI